MRNLKYPKRERAEPYRCRSVHALVYLTTRSGSLNWDYTPAFNYFSSPADIIQALPTSQGDPLKIRYNPRVYFGQHPSCDDVSNTNVKIYLDVVVPVVLLGIEMNRNRERGRAKREREKERAQKWNDLATAFQN